MTVPRALFDIAVKYEREWQCPPTTVVDFLAQLDDEGWTFTAPSEQENQWTPTEGRDG